MPASTLIPKQMVHPLATVTVSGVGITEADDGYELSRTVGTRSITSVTGGVLGGYQMSHAGQRGMEPNTRARLATTDGQRRLLPLRLCRGTQQIRRCASRCATPCICAHPVTVALAGSLGRIRPAWDRGRTTGAVATGTRMALLNAVRRLPIDAQVY